MTKLQSKDQLLENSGYRFNFKRELYLNRELKKAFSVEFIKDHSEEEIAKAIQEPPAGHWRFFFNGDFPDSAARELANMLG